MNKETEDKLKEFLLKKIRPILKQTAGKETDLSEIVVWLENYNDQNNVATLGIALRGKTGCSPFCGCAANQITKLIERAVKREFSFVNKVVGQAGLPSQEVLAEWNEPLS